MKRKTCMALAMMMGLCFSVNLFANVEGNDDPQKKKYANNKFVWTDNYVVEGSNAAMAPLADADALPQFLRRNLHQ